MVERRTGSELLLVGQIILVEIGGLLLGLLVVDGVCTGCCEDVLVDCCWVCDEEPRYCWEGGLRTSLS